jgi:uridylate kinase
LQKGRIVIFAGGTGNPFFTTDTTAALRASEIGADVVIKATKIDGVYDKDPEIHSDAVRYHQLSYETVLEKNLKVMDATAIAFCKDNNLPIIVVNIGTENSIVNAICGNDVGTIIDGDGL